MSTKVLFRVAAVAAITLMVSAIVADARPGSNRSSGSRGSQTNSAPPATNTAPTAAQPMQRTTAPTPAPGMQQPGMAQRPGMAPPAAQPSRWGGLGMGLAAGFLGAGLFGMLAGGGFGAGLGSMAGMFGFLLQLALIGGIIWLAFRFFRSRNPAPAAGSMGHARTGGPDMGTMGGGPIPGAAGGSVASPTKAPSDMVGISPQDFDQFERRLGEVQDAYSREDVNALRALATPEMVSYFADDLKANADRGVINRISNVKLLQGDLSEAWREQDSDYATVAMRYGLVDVTTERASGRVVGGNPAGEQVVELWTFRRPHGGTWVLSAIQQTA
jgi:predicted lipid-binding transport protein (Tim44 family)